MKKIILILIFWFTVFPLFAQEFFIPIKAADRHSIQNIRLTKIGKFGLMRKPRPTVPAHFHTGIDIMRPSDNYLDEPIFPFTDGVVISKRCDGAYAQLILEHNTEIGKLWSVYEHIAGIKVELGDSVNPHTPIALFMNKEELNRYGWQFNHFHFEILKVMPIKINPDKAKPFRFFHSYSLVCFTYEDLRKYFYNPMVFLSRNL